MSPKKGEHYPGGFVVPAEYTEPLNQAFEDGSLIGKSVNLASTVQQPDGTWAIEWHIPCAEGGDANRT